MSNLRTILENSETVFKNMAAAERKEHVKALNYIQFVSSNAKIQLDNADIFKLFGEKNKGINRLVLDPKEINKRIFHYDETNKKATLDESMRCLALVLKRRKIVASKHKALIASLSKITSQGYWRVIDLDRTDIVFASVSDVMMVDNYADGKIVNLGILSFEVSRKTLEPRVAPFKNNYENLHPLKFDDGHLCFGNVSDYIRNAKKAKDLVEVMNIVMLMCAAFNYSDNDGPLQVPQDTVHSGPYDYSMDGDVDDEIESDEEYDRITALMDKQKMTYRAYLYFDLISPDTKVNARTLKSTKNAGKKAKTVKKSEASTKFVDNDHDEDEDDYDEDDYDEDEDY